MKRVFIYSLLFSLVNVTKSNAQPNNDSILCNNALSYLAIKYIKEGKLDFADEMVAANNCARFLIYAFADTLNLRGKNYLKNVIDSLMKLNDRINDLCPVKSGDSLSFAQKFQTSPKFIVFFSKNCNQMIQAYVYDYEARLKVDDYLQDYYGEYASYLFEFKGKVVSNCYGTVIYGN